MHTANIDYANVPEVLRFQAGTGSTQHINISIVDDLIPEGNETFVVTLETDDPAVTIPLLSGLSNATIEIVDNDGMSVYMYSRMKTYTFTIEFEFALGILSNGLPV